MNPEENKHNINNLVSVATESNVNGTEVKKSVSKLVITLLLISWLVYVPSTVTIFILSGMASDSGNISLSMIVAVLAINGLPFIIMCGVSLLAIRKNSLLLAGAPLIILIVYFLFQIQMFSPTLSLIFFPSKKSDISFNRVVPKSEVFFVCEGEEVLKYEGSGIYDKSYNVQRGKWIETGGGRYVGAIKKGELILLKESDRVSLETCKNIKDKTIMDIISLESKNLQN